MQQKLNELAQLLTHGCSRLCIEPVRAYSPPVIWLDCTSLWVEMHLERRLRMASILYGSPEVYAFISALEPGKYTGADLAAVAAEKMDEMQTFTETGPGANNAV